MKLTEFIEFYKQNDVETLKDIAIKQYIPIEKKIEIMHTIDTNIVVDAVNRGDAYAVVKTKMMCKFFSILLAYIDIEVDDTSTKMYDECMAIGIDKLVTRTIQKDDYDRFCYMYDEITMISDATFLREVLRETNGHDIKDDMNFMIQKLSENKDVFANLNEIMGINNAGFKR